MSCEGKETLAYAFSLLEKFGNEPYIGEAVCQLQHAQQAAALAEKEGFGDHVVIGGLSFIPFPDPESRPVEQLAGSVLYTSIVLVATY